MKFNWRSPNLWGPVVTVAVTILHFFAVPYGLPPSLALLIPFLILAALFGGLPAALICATFLSAYDFLLMRDRPLWAAVVSLSLFIDAGIAAWSNQYIRLLAGRRLEMQRQIEAKDAVIDEQQQKLAEIKVIDVELVRLADILKQVEALMADPQLMSGRHKPAITNLHTDLIYLETLSYGMHKLWQNYEHMEQRYERHKKGLSD